MNHHTGSTLDWDAWRELLSQHALVRVSQCQGLPIPMAQRLQYEDGLLAVAHNDRA